MRAPCTYAAVFIHYAISTIDAPAPANSKAPAGRLPQPWLALARLGRPAAGPPNAAPGARVCQWPSTVTELPDLPLSGPCQHLARGRT